MSDFIVGASNGQKKGALNRHPLKITLAGALLVHVMAGFAIGRLIKPGLITSLDGGYNGSGLSFPACRIALLRLVSSKPLGVLRKYFLIGCQIIMKLGLETFFHHFLDLLVGDFFRRIRGVNHRQTKAGDHQA